MHYVCHYFWFSTVASQQQGLGFDALLQQAFLCQVSMHWPCLPPAIPVSPTVKSINDSFIFKNSCFFNFGMSNTYFPHLSCNKGKRRCGGINYPYFLYLKISEINALYDMLGLQMVVCSLVLKYSIIQCFQVSY